MSEQNRLTSALALSLLLHLAMLSLLPMIRSPHLAPTSSLLDVDVLPAPKSVPKPAPVPVPPAAAPPAPAPRAPAAPAQPAPPPPAAAVQKPQIVSPPEVGEEKEPENTNLLSDRNNTVKQESIKRGEPRPSDPDAAPKTSPAEVASAKAAAAPKPVPQRPPPVAEPKPAARVPGGVRGTVEPSGAIGDLAALPKLDKLLPQPGDMVEHGIPGPAEPDTSAPTDGVHRRTDLLRPGDPWHGAGPGGTLDFLPAVRDGDITMLNTKADQFAPFVRRVAVRVFETFWIALRRTISSGVGQSVEETAIIEAVMNRSGQLIALNTKDRSLSAALATDRTLEGAIRQAFFDRNPPDGAQASDGNIHFVFDVRVALMVQPGRGVAGYRAMMGAGLM